MLLASGTTSRFAEALELVGLRLDDKGRLRARSARHEQHGVRADPGRVLAAQNQKQFRGAAIELLEELCSGQGH